MMTLVLEDLRRACMIAVSARFAVTLFPQYPGGLCGAQFFLALDPRGGISSGWV